MGNDRKGKRKPAGKAAAGRLRKAVGIEGVKRQKRVKVKPYNPSLSDYRAAVAHWEHRLTEAEVALNGYQQQLTKRTEELSTCRKELQSNLGELRSLQHEFDSYKIAAEAGNNTRQQLYQGFLAQNEEMKRLAGFLRTCYSAEATMGHHDGLSVVDIVIRYLRIERNIPGWVKWLFQPRQSKPSTISGKDEE